MSSIVFLVVIITVLLLIIIIPVLSFFFPLSLSPLFAEQFNFTVPNNFTRLSLYVCDGENVSRDQRVGHLFFTKDQLSVGHEFPVEKWYDLQSVTPDSEVQVRVFGRMGMGLGGIGFEILDSIGMRMWRVMEWNYGRVSMSMYSNVFKL